MGCNFFRTIQVSSATSKKKRMKPDSGASSFLDSVSRKTMTPATSTPASSSLPSASSSSSLSSGAAAVSTSFQAKAYTPREYVATFSRALKNESASGTDYQEAAAALSEFPLNVVSNLHINILETVEGDEDKAAVAAQILACTSLGSADGAKRLVQDLLGCTPEQATQVYVCTMLADTLKGLINLGALAGGARGGEKLNLSGEDDRRGRGGACC